MATQNSFEKLLNEAAEEVLNEAKKDSGDQPVRIVSGTSLTVVPSSRPSAWEHIAEGVGTIGLLALFAWLAWLVFRFWCLSNGFE